MGNVIKIGFDDVDTRRYDSDEDYDDSPSYRTKVQQEKRKSIYISPERRAALESEFDCVVVHDFGDEYHLTEEERAEKNRYYNTFKVLRRAKRSYRKIDEYVNVMRDALKCLDVVAENNGVYSPEEFKKLYFRGKIYINGLTFPKYKGRDKKDISWEYLSEFILSDRDPKELVESRKDNVLTDDELEERESVLFDDDELDYIMSHESNDELEYAKKFFDVDEHKQEGKNVVVFLDKDESKKYIKKQPELINEIRDIKRDMKSKEHLKYAYDLTADDLESIEAYDRKHNYVSKSDVPEFTGDLMNDKDYRKYLLALEEYEDDNIKEEWEGRMRTRSEIRDLELKSLLEDSGWNIRTLWNNREKEKKLAKAIKRDKKREKELRDQLVKVQNRKNRRMGKDDVDEKKSSKKKKSGKKGKKKKKSEYD